MAQVGIGRPLGKLDLRDERGFERDVIFHFIAGERPLGASLLLRQICEQRRLIYREAV